MSDTYRDKLRWQVAKKRGISATKKWRYGFKYRAKGPGHGISPTGMMHHNCSMGCCLKGGRTVEDRFWQKDMEV